MVRNVSTRCSKALGSCSQTRLWRKTRMVFMPMPSAHPSSRSRVVGSKLSACHISNSLMAVEGRKLAPTGQGCWAYQALAFASVQRSWACRLGTRSSSKVRAKSQGQDFEIDRFMRSEEHTSELQS